MVTVALGVPVPVMMKGICSVKMGAAAKSDGASSSTKTPSAPRPAKRGEGGPERSEGPGEGRPLIRRFAAPSPRKRGEGPSGSSAPRPAKRGEGGPDAERSEAEGPGEGRGERD